MDLRLTRRRFLTSSAATALALGTHGAWLRPAYAKDSFAELDARAQAKLVADGDAAPLELVNAAIARIEALNPKLNAVVTTTFDRAREAARGQLPDGVFRGVPYAFKDLNETAGVRTTHGSRLFADHVPDESTENVRRSQAAGLISLGKTNTPEFGLLATTESILLGPARNPWHPDHSAGGSSGGAAAAVAAGMLPMAQASDGGGSIRIPASCCGVFGLKPSRGRMLRTGQNLPGDISVRHCVSRSVRDSAALLHAVQRRDDAAPLSPMPAVAGPSETRRKIAFATVDLYGDEPEASVKQIVEDTAKLCAELGHEVVDARLPVDGERFLDHFMCVWASGPASLVGLAKSKGAKPEDVLEPWTLGLAEYFHTKPKDCVERAVAYFGELGQSLDAFFQEYDAMLSPVLKAPPPKLGRQAPTVPFDTLWDRTIDYAAYTAVHNAAGTPAMSVPSGWTASGLPVGSQLAARVGNEAMLLELAYELEQARPWADKWAPLSAVNS